MANGHFRLKQKVWEAEKFPCNGYISFWWNLVLIITFEVGGTEARTDSKARSRAGDNWSLNASACSPCDHTPLPGGIWIPNPASKEAELLSPSYTHTSCLGGRFPAVGKPCSWDEKTPLETAWTCIDTSVCGGDETLHLLGRMGSASSTPAKGSLVSSAQHLSQVTQPSPVLLWLHKTP